MNREEFLGIRSEIKQLEEIIKTLPEGSVIERMSFKSRLESAYASIKDIDERRLSNKFKLTFRGKPIFGSHGMSADFAAKTSEKFNDAIATLAASFSDKLKYMGPIPDKHLHLLVITNTVKGSFGFEFELPPHEVGETAKIIPEITETERAIEKIYDIFRLSAEGTDDEVADLIHELHPRAIKKSADFLECVQQYDALCALEVNNHFFRFRDIDQLRNSLDRLKEENTHITQEAYFGEFQGVLPQSRTFEFKLAGTDDILKGKIDAGIDDPDILNRNYLHLRSSVNLSVLQIGQGRPRYTLKELADIHPT